MKDILNFIDRKKPLYKVLYLNVSNKITSTYMLRTVRKIPDDMKNENVD